MRTAIVSVLKQRFPVPRKCLFFENSKKVLHFFCEEKCFCGGQEFSQNQSNSPRLAAEKASLASKNDHRKGRAHNPVLSYSENHAREPDIHCKLSLLVGWPLAETNSVTVEELRICALLWAWAQGAMCPEDAMEINRPWLAVMETLSFWVEGKDLAIAN